MCLINYVLAIYGIVINIWFSSPDFSFIQQVHLGQRSLCSLVRMHEYSLKSGCIMNHLHGSECKLICINTVKVMHKFPRQIKQKSDHVARLKCIQSCQRHLSRENFRAILQMAQEFTLAHHILVKM